MITVPFRGGLRPVGPDLPPTLLPHAVSGAAPPRDRAQSAAIAAGVYLLLAGAAVSLSRVSAAPPLPNPQPPDHGPILIIENPVLLPALPHPAVASALPSSVATGATERPPQAPPSEVPPDVPGNGLPTVNRALEVPAFSGPAGPAAASTTGTGQYSVPIVQQTSVEALRILRQVDPIYPTLARFAHVQGTVVLAMTIDERGHPTEVQVLEGHSALRDEAVRAARLWRFEPASQDGRPVAASFHLTLKFTLK